MKNMEIVYNESTETIRQMPQNYMIASRNACEWGGQSYWVMSPDLAADPKIVCAVTVALLEYENKYSEIPTGAIKKAKELYNKIEIHI